MAVGQEVLAYCGACKLDLIHVIVAHKSGDSGAIAKVKCKTCSAIHGYRAAKHGKEPKPRVSRATRAENIKQAKSVAVHVEWESQLNAKSQSRRVPYFISAELKVGDVIEHPKFGTGIVQTAQGINKVSVLFQDELRLLIHRLAE